MYGNGNIYKEAGNAVAYCNLLYIHRAILLYNFDLFSSHTSQATLPKLKCGQCHGSNLGNIWWKTTNFWWLIIKFYRLRFLQKMTHESTKSVPNLPKTIWSHSICRCLPKCWIHQTCHGHRAIPNRSKLYSNATWKAGGCAMSPKLQDNLKLVLLIWVSKQLSAD